MQPLIKTAEDDDDKSFWQRHKKKIIGGTLGAGALGLGAYAAHKKGLIGGGSGQPSSSSSSSAKQSQPNSGGEQSPQPSSSSSSSAKQSQPNSGGESGKPPNSEKPHTVLTREELHEAGSIPAEREGAAHSLERGEGLSAGGAGLLDTRLEHHTGKDAESWYNKIKNIRDPDAMSDRNYDGTPPGLSPDDIGNIHHAQSTPIELQTFFGDGVKREGLDSRMKDVALEDTTSVGFD